MTPTPSSSRKAMPRDWYRRTPLRISISISVRERRPTGSPEHFCSTRERRLRPILSASRISCWTLRERMARSRVPTIWPSFPSTMLKASTQRLQIPDMGKSYDIDLTEYVPFERVSDEDLQRARIFNKCRMSETGCWLWTGPTNGKGYGVFYVGTKNRHAHRCSYEVFKGPIPDGLHILHRCHTPLCVNPAHLRAGTQKENAFDRQSRGRGQKLRGEKVGTSKMT